MKVSIMEIRNFKFFLCLFFMLHIRLNFFHQFLNYQAYDHFYSMIPYEPSLSYILGQTVFHKDEK